MAEDNNIDPWI